MKDWVLHIYDYLSGHRRMAALLLVILLAFSVLSALRLDFQEDISAFLPQSEESRRYSEVYERLGGQEKMAVFFEGAESEVLKDAMTAFEEEWADADAAGLVPDLRATQDGGRVRDVFDFISGNWPYFLLCGS